MYYVLKCLPRIEADYYRLQVQSGGADRRWTAGVFFNPDDRRDDLHPPTVPILLVTEPEDPEEPNLYAELYWNPIPLMTRRLVHALRAAGVDNLQVYETRLETILGKSPPTSDNYLAVNIVGRVAAAELAKSEINPEVPERLISMDFFSLSVDEAKTRGALMFRLAENLSAVLVHEHVKAQVDRAGIETLTWLRPEEWAG